jgi:diacylglycerol kinase family enzyme
MGELRRALAGLGVPADSMIARAPGDAGRALAAAVAGGTRFVVAVGGDRLARELVTALLGPGGPGQEAGVVLGLAGLGRADLSATFGLPDDPAAAARHLVGGTVFDADVGRARWLGPDRRRRTSLFANVAELGYPAELSARRTGLPMTGRLARLGKFGAAAGALASARSTPAHLTLAHAALDLRLAGLVVANGQFTMGRMKVAPRALPDDGRLSVLAFEGEPLGIFANSAKITFGEHLPDKAIREYQSPTVELDSAQPLALALDGVRLAGGPPYAFDLLPGALRIKV